MTPAQLGFTAYEHFTLNSSGIYNTIFYKGPIDGFKDPSTNLVR